MVETDEELARRARQSMEGDTRAFEEIVRRHQGSVLANCRYLTGSAEDAEDLAAMLNRTEGCGLAFYRSVIGAELQRFVDRVLEMPGVPVHSDIRVGEVERIRISALTEFVPVPSAPDKVQIKTYYIHSRNSFRPIIYWQMIFLFYFVRLCSS